MSCHESARAKAERATVAMCRFCSVGLRKEHLVEMHHSPTKPLYTCLHQPGQGSDTLAVGSTGSRSPAPHRAA